MVFHIGYGAGCVSQGALSSVVIFFRGRAPPHFPFFFFFSLREKRPSAMQRRMITSPARSFPSVCGASVANSLEIFVHGT